MDIGNISRSRRACVLLGFLALLVTAVASRADEPASAVGPISVETIAIETVATDSGDVVRIAGPDHMVVRLDKRLPETLVYSPQGRIEFPIPSDPRELRVYPPGSFTGKPRTLAVRAATPAEIGAYRNVALNSLDVHGRSGFFPHATSNSECRDDPSFFARNAINGRAANQGHGPRFPSWGPDQRTDLWWKVEFGRPVAVDKIVLSIRADFPHDRHWHTATVEFSDGSRLPIQIEKTAKPQTFTFDRRTVEWLRFTDLVQAEPLGWCGFTEVEVWGR
ncbi:MAG TPA: hypothetical protein VE890_09770 [Thermoguttaceae bacterium]|nr:hypothetical protein [Thermoguttaceae bacterium]